MPDPATSTSVGPRSERVWPWPDHRPDVRLFTTRFQPDQPQAIPDVVLPESVSRGVPRRQAEYLAGRRCARDAIEDLTGHPRIPARGADRAPIWPPEVVGAISHCDDRALALVANARHYRAVGVDLERPLDTAAAREVAAIVLTDDERQRWRHDAPADLVGLAFSLKESLFKALYPLIGQPFYFEAAELQDWSADGRARLRLCQDLGNDWPQGRQVEARFCHFDGYLLTLILIPHDRLDAT